MQDNHPQDGEVQQGAARKLLDQPGALWVLLFVVAGVLVCGAFGLVTGHVWEDFLITFRFSRNLVEGHGLVYNPGERVQGFTSVINVMLPAFFHALSGGGEDYQAALGGYTVVSTLAFAGGGAAIFRVMQKDPGSDPRAPLVYALFFLTECKSVSFSVNGQEAGFMILFLSLGLVAAYRGPGSAWRLCAVSWAGLLYTRPDAPLYILVLGVVAVAFSCEPWDAIKKGVLKAGTVAAVAYTPWLLFTFAYYGQPIPQTVLAKSSVIPLDWSHPVGILRAVIASYPRTMGLVFEPIYAQFGGWPPQVVESSSFILGLLCSFYWLVPSQDRLGRMASLGFAAMTTYYAYQNVAFLASPWYLPSGASLGCVVLGRAIPAFIALVPRMPAPLVAARVLQGALVGVSVFQLAASAYQIRIQQEVIELGTRARVGQWLREHAQPRDTIYLEPIGYIGYYSQGNIRDWPGLVAPEVHRLRKQHHASMAELIPHVKADWVVARPKEMAEALALPNFKLNEHYDLVHALDAKPTLKTYGWIPGRTYLEVNAVFLILRRKPSAQEPATTSPAP